MVDMEITSVIVIRIILILSQTKYLNIQSRKFNQLILRLREVIKSHYIDVYFLAGFDIMSHLIISFLISERNNCIISQMKDHVSEYINIRSDCKSPNIRLSHFVKVLDYHHKETIY